MSMNVNKPPASESTADLLRAAGQSAAPAADEGALDDLTQPSGIARIHAERARQIDDQFYTDDHDDERHATGGLALAAICYARAAVEQVRGREPVTPHADWPWHQGTWKPGDAIRNLEKAGALIAAEIDRLVRAEARGVAEK